MIVKTNKKRALAFILACGTVIGAISTGYSLQTHYNCGTLTGTRFGTVTCRSDRSLRASGRTDDWTVNVPAGQTAKVKVTIDDYNFSGRIWNMFVQMSSGKRDLTVGDKVGHSATMTLSSSATVSVSAECTGAKDLFNWPDCYPASCSYSYTIKVEYAGGTGNAANPAPVPVRTPTAKTATVTFNANGGRCYETDYFGSSGTPTLDWGTVCSFKPSVGTKLLAKAPDCSRAGYKFDGWYTAASGGTKIGTSDTVTKSITLYAHWLSESTKVTITFKANGGNGSLGPQTIYSGKKTALLKNNEKITRNGYSFLGWATSSTRTTVDYADGATITRTSKLTLYAVWEPEQVAVYFSENWTEGGMSVAQYPIGKAFGNLPSPAQREGYDFLGWYTASGMEITPATIAPGCSVTYFARWAARAHDITISFKRNDGTSAVVATKEYSLCGRQGEYYGDMPIPERGGYSFIGWYTSASGGERVYSYSQVREDVVTLYAHWSVNAIAEGDNLYVIPESEVECTLKGRLGTPSVMSGVFNSDMYYNRGYWTEYTPSNITFTAGQTGWTTIWFNSEVKLYELDRRTVSVALMDGGLELGKLESSGSIKAYLQSGKTYLLQFTVSGDYRSSKGSSRFNIQIGGDDALIPFIDAPSAPVATETNDGVSLSWKGLPDATVYHIYRRGCRYGVQKSGLTGPDYEYVGSSTSTSYLDKGATHGYAIDYYILADNGKAISGASGKSNRVTLTPHLVVSTHEMSFASGESSAIVTVLSDAYWFIMVQGASLLDAWPDWLSCPGLETRPGDDLLTFQIAENTSPLSRSVQIGLYAKDGDNSERLAETITITQQGRGADVAVTVGKAGSSRTYENGSTYDDLPEGEERPGYTFIGWAADENGDEVITSDTIVSGGVATLYAQYLPNFYTIHFNANGGSGEMEDQNAVCHLPNALSACLFEKSGGSFIGWALSPFGEAIYGDKEMVENLTLEDGEKVVLYAQWEIDAGSVVVRSFEPTGAGATARLVLGRENGMGGRIAVKVKTQTSTGICGTDFAYVKEVLVWEDGDTSDKVIEIPTYASGAGKSLRVKLATLTTGAYAGCVTPKLAESKVYAEMTTPNPGTITVTAPDPLSVEAGETLRMTLSRTGGSDGKIAVKAKTQTSTALMGVNGSADFDYVKKTFEWGDGDATDRHLDIPTYVQPWEGVRMLRVKLATLATGTYAGNLTPALAESKIYAEIESPVAFGTVTVVPETANPVAGETLRLVFRRTGGNDYPIAVKYKVQTSTAVAGVDFEYKKGVVTWDNGEDGEQVVEVPTYPSAAGKQLRVKLSTLTQGPYEGCVTPHLNSLKVYVPLYDRTLLH